MKRFNLLYEQTLKNIELSPFLLQNVWWGECSNGCNGVWKTIRTNSLESIEREFYNDNDKYYIKDFNGDSIKGKQDIKNLNEVEFPLPLYFPQSFKEFKRLLDSGKLIRFTHPGDMIIRLFNYDEKILKAETINTLNELCDWTNAEF